MTLMPGNTLHQGRYIIEGRLGQGGMGTVYLATDRNLRAMRVAIKENSETSRAIQEQFRREAEMLALLQHPNLPRVSNYFIESSGRQYLVMDYIDGQTLRELLSRATGPLSETDVSRWLDQILDTLEYMHNWMDPTTGHQRPIIHRDIKPDNIKIASNGSLYLVDFGIAKVVSGDATMASQRAFSRGFSPLEQYTGGTDPRSDIYSLGATFYSLLTRKLPPEAPLIAAGETELLPMRTFNPQVSRNMEQVILRAMSLAPSERYQSIAEMRQALVSRWPHIRIPSPRLPVGSPGSTVGRLLGDATGTESPGTAPITQRLTRRRVGQLMLTLAAILVILIWLAVRNSTTSPETAEQPAATATLAERVAAAGSDADTPTPVASPPANTPTRAQPSATATLPAATLATPKPIVGQNAATATATEVTPTVVPTLTHTLSATPSQTASATATASSTPTASPEATNMPAATPTTTRTATPVVVTRIPTSTPRPPTPTPVTPTAAPTAIRTNTPAGSGVVTNGFVSLIEPLENPLRGKRTFRWSTNVALSTNQAFELVFWPENGDAMRDGFGPVGATTNTQIEVNLDKSIDILSQLDAGRNYRWGILLVTQSPYTRIQYLGGNHLFRIEYSSGSGSGGGSPTKTPTPRG